MLFRVSQVAGAAPSSSRTRVLPWPPSLTVPFPGVWLACGGWVFLHRPFGWM